MPQFRFRLEKLLTLREAECQQRRAELAEALRAEMLVRQQADELARQLAAIQRSSLAAAAPGIVQVDQLLEQHRYALVLQSKSNLLAERGIGEHPFRLGLGALLGIAFVWWSHEVSGTGELELNVQDRGSETYSSDVLLVGSLHSAAEGLAIGAAMAVDLRLGVWIAVTIALHNIPEATVMAAVFRARHASNARVLLLTLVGTATSVPMAVSSASSR